MEARNLARSRLSIKRWRTIPRACPGVVVDRSALWSKGEQNYQQLKEELGFGSL